MTAFTSAYDDRVGEVTSRVEEIKEGRETARYQEVIDEANSQLEEAKEELEEAQSEVEEQLAEAEQELEDGQSQIDSAKAEIENSLNQLAASESELTAKQGEIDSAKTELISRQAELDTAKTALETQKTALEAGNITKDENYQAAYQQGYNTALLQAYEAVDAELNTQAAQIESVITKLEEEIRALEEAGDTSGKLEELKTQLAVQEAALAQINSDAFRSTVKEQAKEAQCCFSRTVS